MLKLLLVPVLVATSLAVVPSVAAHAAPTASPGATVSTRTMLTQLDVAPESHAGSYRKARFASWVDANGDGENTRTEVLKTESQVSLTLHGDGSPWKGYWRSELDGRIVHLASRTRIDHLVPLKQAWTSGAWKWSATKREAYANDLGYRPALAVVSAKAERAKGDRAPGAYLPSNPSYRCTYVKTWIAVKWRWRLAIDRAEKVELGDLLDRYCSSSRVQRPSTPLISKLVAPASSAAGSTDGDSDLADPVDSTPTAVTPVPTSTSVTPPVYYANCDAVRAAGAAPLHSFQAGYRSALDADGDGVACEDAASTGAPTPTPAPVTSAPDTSTPVMSAPSASGAICRDGTVSSSTHRSGTCSHHGGVSMWL